MTDNTPQRESTKNIPTALFLETSAQILRLQGPAKIQEGIRTLTDAAHLIGTSAHVKREFHYVVNGFFDAVQGKIALLTDPETDRPIQDLWREVRDVQMPIIFPGGNSLLNNLGDYITDLYQGRLVRPMFLDSVVGTYRDQVIRGFNRNMVLDKPSVFDKSTCNVWEVPRGACTLCEIAPSAECGLKDTCVTNRADFLAAAATIADARPPLKESPWFKENLERLHALEGKPLQEFLSKHPGQVGDLIIFWEVPDGWTVLSRDRAFRILRDEHREEIEFFMVRIPRKDSGNPCALRPEGDAAEFEGTLDNYNSQGARVHAPGMTVSARQRITIQAKELSPRVGEVTKFREPSSAEEAQRNQVRPTFGLRFKTSKAKRQSS
jgi:hypothetical protein